MTYRIDADPFLRGVAATLSEFEQRQLPYAAERTLNALAGEVRDALRGAYTRHLTVRGPQSARFIEQSIQHPREDRARKDRLHTRVVVDRLAQGRSFLPSFATPGHVNRAGPWGPVAVPTRALRPSPRTVIPRAMYPRALGVLASRDVSGGLLWARTATRSKKGRVRKGQRLGPQQTESGKWIIRGQARTFALDPRFHRGNMAFGVYQRVGPGRTDIRKLWTYDDAAPLPARVPYQRTVDEILATRLRPIFDREFAVVMATAR